MSLIHHHDPKTDQPAPPQELEQVAPDLTATHEDPDSTFGSSSLPTLDELSPLESHESSRRRNIFRAVGVVVAAGTIVVVGVIVAQHRGSSEETTPNPTTPSTLGLPAPGEAPKPDNASPLDGKEVVWNFGDQKGYKLAYSPAVLDQVKQENNRVQTDTLLNKFSGKHNLLYPKVPGTTQTAAFGECIVSSTQIINTSDNSTHRTTTITVNPIQFVDQDPTPGSSSKFIHTASTGLDAETGYQVSKNGFYQVDKSNNIIYPNFPDDLKPRIYTTDNSKTVDASVMGLFTKDPTLSNWHESGFIATTTSDSTPGKMVVGGIVTIKDLPQDQEKPVCDYLVSISHS